MNEQARIKPTDDDLAKVKAAHKRFFRVTAKIKDDLDGVEVELTYELFCRGPTRAEWQRYMDAAGANKGTGHKAAGTMFTQCLVWPTLKELAPEFDDNPPLETLLAGLFLAAVEERFEGEGKKGGRI